MRILVVTPILREPNGRARLYARAVASILNLQWPGQIDHYVANGGDDYLQPSETVTRKYQEAREVFLAGKWDYLFAAEYDMILPPDTLTRLVNLEADIAYGLYVFRHGQPKWNAALTVQEKFWQSFADVPTIVAARAWNTVQTVAGLGMGCTLLKRETVAALPFRNWKGVACDWALAYDALGMGLTQRMDLGVVCGHMSLLPAPCVFWPDVNEPELYRVENL